MNTDELLPFEGGCTCRSVSYRMTTKPLFVHCCHCRWCQREPWAFIQRLRAAQQLRLASFIDAMEGKHVDGEVDFYGDNADDFPLPGELMKNSHFPSWHLVAGRHKSHDMRLARDGDGPSICLPPGMI